MDRRRLLLSFSFLLSCALSSAYAAETHFGTHDLDGVQNMRLELLSLTVYPQKANGRAWDLPPKSAPDLYARVEVDGRVVLLTELQPDRLSARFEQASEAFYYHAGSKVQVSVFDRDLAGEDLISSFRLPRSEAALRGESELKRFSQGRLKEIQLRFSPLGVQQNPRAVAITQGSSSTATKEVAQSGLGAPTRPAPVSRLQRTETESVEVSDAQLFQEAVAALVVGDPQSNQRRLLDLYGALRTDKYRAQVRRLISGSSVVNATFLVGTVGAVMIPAMKRFQLRAHRAARKARLR